MGLPPPDPCPLSLTEFVEPPSLNKIPVYATAADNLNNPSWKCGQPVYYLYLKMKEIR
jgi:hypothetical protein